MKKLVLSLTVIMAALMFMGCSKNNSPEAVVETALKAVQSKDAEAFADCYFYEGTDSEKKAKRAKIVAELLEDIDDEVPFKSYEILKTEMKGDDKATVTIKLVGEDGETDEEHHEVIKIDGKWYIGRI